MDKKRNPPKPGKEEVRGVQEAIEKRWLAVAAQVGPAVRNKYSMYKEERMWVRKVGSGAWLTLEAIDILMYSV